MNKTVISTAVVLALAPSSALAEPELGRPSATAVLGGEGSDSQAVQRYVFAPDTSFTIRCAPGRVTTLTLQPGETILGPLEVGDAQRWIVGQASGPGWTRVALKPVQPELATNLTVHTNRRTYFLEPRSQAAAPMTSVEWSYPAPIVQAGR